MGLGLGLDLAENGVIVLEEAKDCPDQAETSAYRVPVATCRTAGANWRTISLAETARP